MIKNILILLILGFAIYFLNLYYQQSSMHLKEQTVQLTTKEGSYQLTYEKRTSKSENFSNLSIEETILTDHRGENAFYEVATIEGLYQFNSDIKTLITTLFGAKQIKLHFALNELKMMQLTLKSGERINLFVMDNDNKKIELFYGVSSEKAMEIVRKISKNTQNLTLEKSDTLTKSMTQWSVLHNNFGEIIESIDY